MLLRKQTTRSSATDNRDSATVMTIPPRDMDHERTDTMAHSNEVSTNLSTLPFGLEWAVVTPEKRICYSCKNLPIGRVCDFLVKKTSVRHTMAALCCHEFLNSRSQRNLFESTDSPTVACLPSSSRLEIDEGSAHPHRHSRLQVHFLIEMSGIFGAVDNCQQWQW